MPTHSVFLSVAFLLRNNEPQLVGLLQQATQILQKLVSDYEIILVDNASDDDSLQAYKHLTGVDGLPNLQVYALTKNVDIDTASWVGLENALGDFVAVLDPMVDDIHCLPEMLERAIGGADVVFARNLSQVNQGAFYRGMYRAVNYLYRSLANLDLIKEAPHYRLMNKKVINFILQHPRPAISYRHLPATGGFSRFHMEYRSDPLQKKAKKLTDSLDRGMRLLMSTTRAPMRIVSGLALFGAVANVFYSIYVLAIGLLRDDIAPGWVSLSLQQSGMFFLLSLVLMVLGEYILNMASLSNEGPAYHVAQEFTSARMTRREKLNIEEAIVDHQAN